MSKLPCLLFLLVVASTSVAKDATKLCDNIISGDNRTLNQLEGIIKAVNHSLTDDQSAQLVEAIGFALIKNPVATLRATNMMDKDKDILVQRFGTGAVCALPIIMDYTKNSTLKYYRQASESLRAVGKPAKECLDIMRATMVEVESLDGRGEMKWGTKIY